MALRTPTPENPTGPAYRAGAPFRSRLAPESDRGRPMLLEGRVLHADGTPVRGAILDVWHASSRGMYDLLSREMRYRGQVRCGEGRFVIRTIEPHGYLWRPPHVHLEVREGGEVVLTTQLYLPGHWRLAIDPAVHPLLILRPEERADGSLHVRYDVILA